MKRLPSKQLVAATLRKNFFAGVPSLTPNAGHLLDHYMVLIFATAAAVRLTTEWDISYAGFANSPLQIGVALTLVGIFAAIYHPVGLAMVVDGRTHIRIALAINGVFGNLGVASAALVTGFLIDSWGWRSEFSVPGAVSILLGLLCLA